MAHIASSRAREMTRTGEERPDTVVEFEDPDGVVPISSSVLAAYRDSRASVAVCIRLGILVACGSLS
jgi:hypothetical protein